MSVDAYVHLLQEAGPGRPLLVVLHGTGGDEHQFAGLGRHLLPDATIVSPRGDVSESGAARYFRRAAEGVYDMADLKRATDKMVRFVSAHVAQAQPSAVVGLGYSNGANILATTLSKRPDLFDAVVLMHPLIPFEPVIEPGMLGRRVLITAGRNDPIGPAAQTLRLEGWLRDAGAAVTLHWHDGGHEIRPDEFEAARDFLEAVTPAGGQSAASGHSLA